jgi:RimJ/RimL family protein N-acetyltransferase
MGRLSPASALEVAVTELRDPEPRDAWFVVDLLVQGAQGSFFNPHLAQPATLLALVQQLQMMTRNQQILTPDGWIWSRVFMLNLAQHTVGFGWLAEESPQRPGDAIEIAAISITPARRGQGFGTRLLNGVLTYLQNEFPQRAVVARCRPASAQMEGMLRARGFETVSSGADSVELRLSQAGAPEPASTAAPDNPAT